MFNKKDESAGESPSKAKGEEKVSVGSKEIDKALENESKRVAKQYREAFKKISIGKEKLKLGNKSKIKVVETTEYYIKSDAKSAKEMTFDVIEDGKKVKKKAKVKLLSKKSRLKGFLRG